jgi:OOP family OmpA-OmpF porin
MRAVHLYIILLTALCSSHISYAQRDHNAYDFVPREKVIFEDDFSHDTVGKFPARWVVSPISESKFLNAKKFWKVTGEADERILHSATTFLQVTPDEQPTACAEIYFSQSDNLPHDSSLCLHLLSWGAPRATVSGKNIAYEADTAVNFKYAEWHHFSFRFFKNEIKWYVDDHLIMKIPDCGFKPNRISLGCIAPVKYKNFRLTTGKEVNMFSKIITDKKVVTNAIHFDVGKWEIKTESRVVVMQLAQFLKANASVNLEIGGHTDNDGDAVANIKLSQARADEVKNQLIALGISAAKLTTKGYGATKPIAKNTTWQGKAKNRRVEFVKL